MFFGDVGQLWSAKLVAAIASQCVQQEANIQTQTEVYEVQKESGASIVKTNRGSIKTQNVVYTKPKLNTVEVHESLHNLLQGKLRLRHL